MSAQGSAARRFPPNVFKRLVRLKKMSAVEQGEAAKESAMNLKTLIAKVRQTCPTVFNSFNDLDHT